MSRDLYWIVSCDFTWKETITPSRGGAPFVMKRRCLEEITEEKRSSSSDTERLIKAVERAGWHFDDSGEEEEVWLCPKHKPEPVAADATPNSAEVSP